jgi:reductive dehalogenase
MTHQVREPTYEVVGPLERFDERDTVFARERLVPGSREAEAYYSARPELRRIDQRLRRFIQSKEQAALDKSQLMSTALYEAVFGSVNHLGLPDAVDGPTPPAPLQISPTIASQSVRTMAHYLGADLVRIGPLNPAWVYSHRGSPPFFETYPENAPHYSGLPDNYTGRRYGDPIHVAHRHAISLGFAQKLALVGSGPTPASDLEIGRVYARSALVAVQLARFIRGLGYPARAHHMRNYGLLCVPVAVDAGMGELGRCGFLITKELGTNLRLSCVSTEFPMELDQPVDLRIHDYCSTCLRCVENCPPGAIPSGEPVVVNGVRKWKIDEVKCLLYWAHKGSACPICQAVCPWSKPRTPLHNLVREIAVRLPAARPWLARADGWVYGARFRPRPVPEWLCEGGEAHQGNTRGTR